MPPDSAQMARFTMPNLYAGTSGFAYASWKPDFYPDKLPSKKFLGYYSTRLNAVEVNYTFRRLPSASTLENWANETQPGFVFPLKAHMRITHINRLKPSEFTDVFFKAIDPLRSARRLGPVLFQLPPTQEIDTSRLRSFLALLTQNQRWVVEFRHPSWHTGETYQLLAEAGVALCIPVGGRLEPDRITTAPSTYIRMHRGQGPAGGFTKEELKSWAAQVRALAASGKEVYIYFNNDWEGFALRDAVTFEWLLGLEGTTRPGDVHHPQHDSVLSGLTIPPSR